MGDKGETRATWTVTCSSCPSANCSSRTGGKGKGRGLLDGHLPFLSPCPSCLSCPPFSRCPEQSWAIFPIPSRKMISGTASGPELGGTRVFHPGRNRDGTESPKNVRNGIGVEVLYRKPDRDFRFDTETGPASGGRGGRMKLADESAA